MNQKDKDDTCPLCQGAGVEEFCHHRGRDYQLCLTCRLVFVPPRQFLSPAEERARYDHHQNSPLDHRYREFLSRLLIPLNERLKPGSRGLDFGCGPGPTLSVMFNESGHPMEIYDPNYAPEPSVLHRRYDFITATEVLEHLYQPGLELDRLWSLLKPGGHLGIMTQMVQDESDFSQWFYKNDPTHVCFYSRPTFQWLAQRWQGQVDFPDRDVILFQKPIYSGVK